jgi:hypothetical protein
MTPKFKCPVHLLTGADPAGVEAAQVVGVGGAV